MGKPYTYILSWIFFIVLLSRLYFAFSTPYFSDEESYFNLRQIEHIALTGKPLFQDSLSYSGRTFVFSPLFHYVLAFFHILIPITGIKLILNIFASVSVVLVYLISKEITQKEPISLFTALFSGFIPIFFASTFNSILVLTLAIPFILLLIYSFLRVNKKFWMYCYFITIIIGAFATPYILLFCLSLVFYLLIVLAENLKISREELEISIFTIFFVLWSQFLIYKEVILFHGMGIFWQNIPKDILASYFSGITIIEAAYQIGILPILLGIYVVYKYLFREKKKDMLLLISFALASVILLWLRLIELKAGLIFSGIALVLLFTKFYEKFLNFIVKTRATKYKQVFSVILFVLFSFTSVYPSYVSSINVLKNSITDKEVNALLWLKENTGETAAVLATPGEGNYINYIARRRNVMDTNFLMKANTEQIFSEVKRIFTTNLEVEAIDLMEKYDVDYIYLSASAKKSYGVTKLAYQEASCIEQKYENEKVTIFRRPPSCEVMVFE